MVLSDAKLLHICLGEIEVWHGVTFLYRDPDWGTPKPVITLIDVTPSDDGFRVRYEGYFPTWPPINLFVEIDGTNDGRVRFAGEAVPTDDIWTNRLGICLMHPMSVAGARIEVGHVDGRLSRSTFPTSIPPWPPFMLIRTVRHEYAKNQWARCDFVGDSFELEDQRNNSDASFKTYSRSNLMPRPYCLRAGVPIRHSVDLRLESPWPDFPPRRASAVTVSVGEEVGVLPKIGIEISAGDASSDDATRAALRAIQPALLHLAMDGDIDRVNWDGINELLRVAGAQLRLDLTLPNVARSEATLNSLRAALLKANLVPESIAVFPSEQVFVDFARRTFPDSLIGGGTPNFFAQLNRLEGLGVVDFVSFTTSPIVHGADDGSVMLSLQSLPSMVDTLRARAITTPVRVGPSSIAVRKSPLGGQPLTDGTRRVAMANQDPRCHGLFGAAWALGYIAQFSRRNAEAITIMSLSGSSGIVGSPGGSCLVRYPTYFLLERLRAPARVCRVSVSDPSRIAALALRRAGKGALLIANLTGDDVELDLNGWAATSRASIMDADSWATLSSSVVGWQSVGRTHSGSRIRLSAYATASLEESP